MRKAAGKAAGMPCLGLDSATESGCHVPSLSINPHRLPVQGQRQASRAWNFKDNFIMSENLLMPRLRHVVPIFNSPSYKEPCCEIVLLTVNQFILFLQRVTQQGLRRVHPALEGFKRDV